MRKVCLKTFSGENGGRVARSLAYLIIFLFMMVTTESSLACKIVK